FAVGNVVDRAVGVAQDGASEAHGLDGALHAGDLYDVADVVLVLEQNEEAIDYILDQRLSAEADGKTNDASGGDQRLNVDVEGSQDLDEGAEADDKDADAVDDAGEGAKLLRTNSTGKGLSFAEALQAAGDDPQKPKEQERNQNHDQDFWSILPHEFQRVAAPLM